MTDNSNADTLHDLGRLIAQLMNWGIYILLAVMYQVFFNVASAQLFESETIKNFYARFQLIVGVFMVFKLAVSILQGIMDPDKFMNPKEGFGNFITRVVISLALLTVIVPINVPDVENANSFEKYLNNDGLLFGTLYSLQDRILSSNTLGRLILGTTDNATLSEEENSGKTEEEIQKEKLAKSSRIFTSTILKAFLKINMLPSEAREDDDETKRENWYCGNDLDDKGNAAIETYRRLDVDPTTLLSWEILTADCEINESFGDYVINAIPILEDFVENSRYIFSFNWFVSMIVGVVFLVILVGFTYGDTEKDIDYLANKVIHLRIFDDENGVMNRSLLDVGGSILSISQFTLYADTRKGRRPSYVEALEPMEATRLYELWNQKLKEHNISVETGIFGAEMIVNITNDGPITIMMESREKHD